MSGYTPVSCTPEIMLSFQMLIQWIIGWLYSNSAALLADTLASTALHPAKTMGIRLRRCFIVIRACMIVFMYTHCFFVFGHCPPFRIVNSVCRFLAMPLKIRCPSLLILQSSSHNTASTASPHYHHLLHRSISGEYCIQRLTTNYTLNPKPLISSSCHTSQHQPNLRLQ